MAHHNGSMKQGLFLLLWQVVIVILFFLFVQYDDAYDPATGKGKHNSMETYYTFYSHVASMAIVGFGFLMTFVRRYRFGAVAYTFLVTVLIFQWSILTLGFWERVQNGKWREPIHLSIAMMVDAMFAACSCLIALGGMIGKVSIWQFLFLSVFHTIFYSANYILGYKTLKVADIGGSMYIHLFGACWGLAATWWLNPKGMHQRDGFKAQGASYSSDMFSMIGTVFLWLYWPSFNGALALHDTQARVAINTVLSLTGSCLVTFGWSVILRHEHKFCMEDIQNATLAGGVAIGTAADLVVGPGGAIMVGAAAGFLSVFGYTKLLPFLFRKFGFHDSCGILALHLIPGFLGGIVGAIVTGIATPEKYGPVFAELLPHGPDGDQWKYQLACIGHTLAISIVGGLIFGWIAHWAGTHLDAHYDDLTMFDDRHAFEVPGKNDHHDLIKDDQNGEEMKDDKATV